MARSSVQDPLTKFRWTVSIDGFSKSGFHTTSVPSYTITNRKYKEGGAHLTPRKIISSIDYGPVTLSRGVTNDTSFNIWATGFMDKVTNEHSFPKSDLDFNNGVQGFISSVDVDLESAATSAFDNGARPVRSVPSGKTVKDFNYRRNVKIEHTNRLGQVDIIYYLYNAFPIEYKPASDFNAMADDGVSIETLVLDYESMEVKYTGIAGAVSELFS